MNPHHMDQSDQSEIDLINDSPLTNGMERQSEGPKKGGGITSHEVKDGHQHTVSSNRSKGRADCWE